MEQEETICDDMEAVGKLTYLRDRVSVVRGCEATENKTSEQNVVGLGLWSAVSCCMAGYFLKG